MDIVRSGESGKDWDRGVKTACETNKEYLKSEIRRIKEHIAKGIRPNFWKGQVTLYQWLLDAIDEHYGEDGEIDLKSIYHDMWEND